MGGLSKRRPWALPKPEDLGTLSQALLRKLLKKFPKNFQNFNQGGFYPYVYVVRILYVAIYKLRIPAAPRPIPSTELARRQLVALSHLRYRIKVVSGYSWTSAFICNKYIIQLFSIFVYRKMKNSSANSRCFCTIRGMLHSSPPQRGIL